MDERFKKKKYNNTLLFESKNINKNSKNSASTKIENQNNYKFHPDLNSSSPNFKKPLNSITENKNESQEFKENVFNNDKINNIKDESRKKQKFIRLKKGIQITKKPKTSRNIKNNNKNKIILTTNNDGQFDLKIQRKDMNNKELRQKQGKRISETLNHSYSFDNYLNITSNLGFKYKSPFQNKQLFENSFVQSIKSEKRKTELIQALEKYKKFRTLIPPKTEKRFHSYRNLKKNFCETENETENVGKRLEQINRIKIQNIINFEKLYENIHKKNFDKYMDEYYKRKTYDYGRNHKKIYVRQLLREEKYIIDDDGREKIFEINQSVFSNKANMNKDEYLNDKNLQESEKKIKEFKEKIKNSNKKIIIYDKNSYRANNEKNNCTQQRRSFPNNKDIKTFINNSNNDKNKIFIKKHPSRLKTNSSSNLNNNNKISNKKIININQYSERKFLDNNIKNHSFREIKKVSKDNEKGKNQKILRYNKKTLNDNFYKDNNKRQNTFRNNNNFINKNQTSENKNYPNNQRINIENNKNIFNSNRSFDSKGNSKNNFIYKDINKNKQNNINPRQFILFNLNNQNNSELNKNNNFIIINTSNDSK